MSMLRRRFLGAAAGLSIGCVSGARIGRGSAAYGREPVLRVVTRDGPAIGGPAASHGRSFAREAGIPVEVTHLPFDRLYDEIMIGFVTGAEPYDVLLVPSAWVADFAPYLAAVPAPLLESASFADIHPTYRDALMRWGDRWVAWTVDGDLHIGAYRTDLFEDPEHRSAFEDRFGRPLQPPETWAEYYDIAAFFHGRRQADRAPLAGTAEAFAEGGQRVWFLASRAAAYAHDPERSGALFFDPETMAPAINGPAWERALTEYRAALAFAPDAARQMDSYDVRSAFVAGRAAMNIDWTDTGVLTGNDTVSRVAGKTGFFMLPGCRERWDAVRQSWQALDRVRRVPFLAFGGWVAAVPAASRAREAAWGYIAWLSTPERSARDVTDGSAGFNPYRLSHLDDTDLWSGVLSVDDALAYQQVIRQSLDHPLVTRDLRIPGVRAYQAALDRGIGAVLEDRATPSAALADVGLAWDRITDRLGRDAQARHYRTTMGLNAG